MPTVSVLIPCYNHSAFLRQCLDSVLAQTFQDWEVVLVDDVSPDDSFEIASSYSDPRIRVYRNESNLGTYGTQARCLELAEGEFVAVLNSDDYWMSTKLEKQVALLQAHSECPFAYCRGRLTDLKGKETSSDEQHGQMPVAEVQDLRPWLVIDNRILASSLMFRRGKAGFDGSMKYSGDWKIVLQLCQLGPAAFVNEDLSVWRIHGENAHTDLIKHFGEVMRVREAILAKPDRWQGEGVNEGLLVCAFHLHAFYVLVGESAKAKALMKWALSVDPGNAQAKKRSLLAWLPASVQQKRLAPGRDPASYGAAYRAMDKTPINIDP